MTRTVLLVAAAAALYVIARVLRSRTRSPKDPAVSATLRLEVLSRRMLTGITTPTPDGVLGAAMDWNVGNGLATLVALVDGTVSLYVLPGSGTIGAGSHSSVATAAERFLQTSRQARSALHVVRDYPPPAAEQMVFYLLLRDRTLASDAIPVSQLQTGTHRLSAVAGLAQALLTEVRNVSK